MAAETALTASPPAADVPRRTWRQWWRQLPGYWRIGAWAMVALIALHGIVAIRIAVGLMESEDISAFQRQGVSFGYFNRFRHIPVLFRGQHLIFEGLFGRSNANVGDIFIDGASDADLKYIGEHFPNLEAILIWHADISATGLADLRRCGHLKAMEFSATDLDDAAVEELANFVSLETLHFSGGLLPEKADSLSARLPRLTDQRIHALGRSAADETTNSYESVALIVRWADGERSANAKLPYNLAAEVPEPESGIRVKPLFCDNRRLEGIEICPKYHLKHCGNGEYTFFLRLGRREAAPVAMTIIDGMAPTNVLEFQMPVTKAEVDTIHWTESFAKTSDVQNEEPQQGAQSSSQD